MLQLLLALVLAQEDLDARLEALAPKLAKDVASAALAELCASEFGRAAIRERVDALVNHRAGRLDRDPQGRFEELVFRADETGALHVRPERQAEIERLAADVAASHTQMASFNRRAFELAGKIQGEGEMEKKARAWWSDSTFRVAFFASRVDDLRERDLAGLLDDYLGRAFVAVEGGKRRISAGLKPETRDAMQGVYARLDRIQALEKAYLKNLAGLEDAARQALVTETATLFLVGRLLRHLEEDVPGPIGELAEGANGEESMAFGKPLAEWVAPLREAEKTLEELRPWFESTSAALAGGGPDETAAADFLKNPRARVLVVERLLGRKAEQQARADAVFAEVVADSFEQAGAGLLVKKGRYVNEESKDSVEALDGEHRGVVDGFLEGRRHLDTLAELCADPKAAWTFSSHLGTVLVQEHIGRLIVEERRAIEERGFDLFAALYLESKGDVVTVRPDRAPKIQDLVRRAAAIVKERSGQ